MKVGIIGAGSMGSVFFHILGKDDIELVVYEKSAQVVDSISQHGLKVDDMNGENIYHPSISNSPSILTGSEYVLIFVKCYSTGELLSEIAPFLGKETYVISLQNGLGNREVIERYISTDKCIMGTTTVGATKTSYNSASITGYGTVSIDCSGPGEKKIRKIFNHKSLDLMCTDKIDKILVEKGMINAAINPIGALFSMTNGEIIKNKFTKKIQERVIDEITSLPGIIDLGISTAGIKDRIQRVCERTSSNRCSMLQDLENGRMTEIDYINGYFLKEAEKEKIKLHYNNFLIESIKALELKGL